MWVFLVLLYLLEVCHTFVIVPQFVPQFGLVHSKTSTWAKKEPLTVVNVEDIYADMWRVDEAAKMLKEGKVGVIPTDTCYSFVASISHSGAVERLLKLKGGSGHRKPLSVLCKNLSQISEYTNQVPRHPT